MSTGGTSLVRTFLSRSGVGLNLQGTGGPLTFNNTIFDWTYVMAAVFSQVTQAMADILVVRHGWPIEFTMRSSHFPRSTAHGPFGTRTTGSPDLH